MFGMGMGSMGPMGMMGMGGMGGMGMGMMPGMGVPMGMPMPMGMPIPGVMPGMPGTGFYNSLPGRFGRDMLGRDFAGPGGVGSSQPYRPPDPLALPPMPFGLPFIARPGQEGFDQYGRMIPPELPEGWDGWGRPILSGTAAPPAAPPVASQPPTSFPPPGPYPPAAGADPTATQDMPMNSSAFEAGAGGGPGQGQRQGQPLSASTGSTPLSADSGRPEQPPCFDRPPATADSYFRYEDFEPFALSAGALNEAWKLHIPRELIGHDVSQEDWSRFISDLRREALTGATHGAYDYHAALRADPSRGVSRPRGPQPVLNDTVHSLLASWAVAFFLPRGIRVYAAQDGKRVVPPPIEPHGRSRRGYSRADEFSDTAESASEGEESEWWEEEEERRREDMYLPRRERGVRSRERMRERRMRKRMKEFEANKRKKGRIGSGYGSGIERRGWEVHFVPSQPTLWQPGMRPRTYGEPVVRVRR